MRKFSESKAQCLFPLLPQYRTCALQFKEGTACPPPPSTVVRLCGQHIFVAYATSFSLSYFTPIKKGFRIADSAWHCLNHCFKCFTCWGSSAGKTLVFQERQFHSSRKWLPIEGVRWGWLGGVFVGETAHLFLAGLEMGMWAFVSFFSPPNSLNFLFYFFKCAGLSC